MHCRLGLALAAQPASLDVPHAEASHKLVEQELMLPRLLHLLQGCQGYR